MKIIDKKQDFYDYATVYYDDTVVYDRRESNSVVIDFNKSECSDDNIDCVKLLHNRIITKLKAITIPFGILFYGNKFALKFPVSIRKKNKDSSISIPIFEWKDTLEHLEKDIHFSYFYRESLDAISSLNFDDGDIEELMEIFDSPLLFIGINCPRPSWSKNRIKCYDGITYYNGKLEIVTNPNLVEEHLIGNLDAMDVYNGIENMLIRLNDPSKRMVDIDDEHKAAGHGFGHKYAFRKEPKKS